MSDPQRDDDLSAAAVVEAVADTDSRAILEAAATGPKTVADLVEECEIPTATAYRKVARLADSGLLAERVRIRPNGRNAATYQLRDEEISVSVGGSVVLEIDGSPSQRDQATTPAVSNDDAGLHLEHVTDGGRESIESASGTRTERLQTLFVDITGTDKIVVEQNVEFSSRDIDDDAASISTYVAAVTKDDGLTDTIDHPELDSPK